MSGRLGRLLQNYIVPNAGVMDVNVFRQNLENPSVQRVLDEVILFFCYFFFLLSPCVVVLLRVYLDNLLQLALCGQTCNISSLLGWKTQSLRIDHSKRHPPFGTFERSLDGSFG